MRLLLTAALLVIVLLLGCATETGEVRSMLYIAAIGDSMVDAVGRNSVADTTQWLYKLLQQFGETSISLSTYTPPDTPTTPNNLLTGAEWTAYNLGVGSQTSTQILSRFDADVPANSDFVIIECGHNDIYFGVSLATVEANLDSMCDKARALGAVPILCTVPPYNTAGGATTQMKDDIDTLNARMAASGETVCDWYTALETDAVNRESTYILPDNIHLNVSGCALVGLLVADLFDAEYLFFDLASSFEPLARAEGATGGAAGVAGGASEVEGAEGSAGADAGVAGTVTEVAGIAGAAGGEAGAGGAASGVGDVGGGAGTDAGIAGEAGEVAPVAGNVGADAGAHGAAAEGQGEYLYFDLAVAFLIAEAEEIAGAAGSQAGAAGAAEAVAPVHGAPGSAAGTAGTATSAEAGQVEGAAGSGGGASGAAQEVAPVAGGAGSEGGAEGGRTRGPWRGPMRGNTNVPAPTHRGSTETEKATAGRMQ